MSETVVVTGASDNVELRRGDAEAVTDELPGLLGRPSRRLRTYLEDNAALWAVER